MFDLPEVYRTCTNIPSVSSNFVTHVVPLLCLWLQNSGEKVAVKEFKQVNYLTVHQQEIEVLRCLPSHKNIVKLFSAENEVRMYICFNKFIVPPCLFVCLFVYLCIHTNGLMTVQYHVLHMRYVCFPGSLSLFVCLLACLFVCFFLCC